MIINKQILWGLILALVYVVFFLISINVMGISLNSTFRPSSILTIILCGLLAWILTRAFLEKRPIKPPYFYVAFLALIAFGIAFAFIRFSFSYTIEAQFKTVLSLGAGMLPVGVISYILLTIGLASQKK